MECGLKGRNIVGRKGEERCRGRKEDEVQMRTFKGEGGRAGRGRYRKGGRGKKGRERRKGEEGMWRMIRRNGKDGRDRKQGEERQGKEERGKGKSREGKMKRKERP
jgi:hypothetical protein